MKPSLHIVIILISYLTISCSPKSKIVTQYTDEQLPLLEAFFLSKEVIPNSPDHPSTFISLFKNDPDQNLIDLLNKKQNRFHPESQAIENQKLYTHKSKPTQGPLIAISKIESTNSSEAIIHYETRYGSIGYSTNISSFKRINSTWTHQNTETTKRGSF